MYKKRAYPLVLPNRYVSEEMYSRDTLYSVDEYVCYELIAVWQWQRYSENLAIPNIFRYFCRQCHLIR